jgi:peptidoglycan/xylan/chitin deacetylase (PgdA/CDA1 family)
MAGALCISIDVELAWGIWDKPSAEYHARCAAHEAEIIGKLVALFERYEVSATWAIVGRLLERDAQAAKSTAYGDAIWYAPAVIDQIRAARVAQDIGSHSYGHVYFGETPREALRRDLTDARRVHDRHGLPFTSFVFPRNQVAHLDLLREAGVRVFRSVDHGWHMAVRERLGRSAGRVANLADKLLPIAPAAVQPIAHGGGPARALIELPSSMLLMARNGLRRAVHPLAIVGKARRGLAAARRTGGIFHLWFHPSNFYYQPERQLATLDGIVAAAVKLRDRGELEIRPMSSYQV